MKSTVQWFLESKLRLLWISRRRFPARNRMGATTFLPFRIWHVETGHASFRMGGKTLRLKPGDWAFVPSRFDEQFIAEGTLLTTLALGWECPGGRQPLLGMKPERLQGDVRRRVAARVGILLAWARKDGVDPGFNHRVDEVELNTLEFTKYQQMLWALLEEVVRKAQAAERQIPSRENSDPRMLRLSEILRENSVRPFPGKVELARQLSLSWRRVEQLFDEHAGTTPRQYHHRLRAECARNLLLAQRLSIKEIAFHLGFPSVSGFSQWFKAQHQSSPAHYRKGAAM